MAKSKVHQKTRAPKARAEQPVSEGIRRAAERAGITHADRGDSERVTLLRGDLNLVVAEIKAGFEEILEAEFFTTGAERDSLVLSVLRRLRNAETVIGVTSGGAS
jgi:hypothetical protein